MAVGPVEYLVVAFPGSRFTGAIAPALAEAVASKAVRILDLTFVYRTEDGAIETVELEDLDPDDLVSFEPVEGEVTGMLNSEDIRTLGESVPPGSSAALIVWEDLWALPITEAVRASGGRLVAHERIPAEVAEAAVAAAATER
ncbi:MULTISPECIES: DUF6325 family protein [unclassified Streptomyces]|uniref:DUF6325 family protein n=1 Tax=unclassified Streptomyces TaxID=2593676 RepID=UPI0022563573|nr:DUF6325 family protein [Streptomyces sp. NBC_00338]MCX5144739.1 DUF1269 domain-containing protein [Streptomyces sp. NBC_00338]WSU56963.1 DUF1269 domain-containing protein [Streptomyces sp. NBC_01104]